MVCRVCILDFPLSEFHKDARLSRGVRSRCKNCDNDYASKMRQENPEKFRLRNKVWRQTNPANQIFHNSNKTAKNLRFAGLSKWGTIIEFQNWYAAQEKICEVCQSVKDLCVDHCHKTGKPRGILCRRCNTAEGQLETIERTEALLTYMKRHLSDNQIAHE